jgi:hypothetical protein
MGPHDSDMMQLLVLSAQTCFTTTDKAQDGPMKGTAKTQLCQALMACVRRTKCSATQDEDCWCGIGADLKVCENSTSSANFTGPCKAEVEAAAEGTKVTTVAQNFYDQTFAAGAAFFLLDYCDTDPTLCEGPCITGVSPTGAAGTTGTSGAAGTTGTSGAAGTTGTSGSAGTNGAAGTSAAAGTNGAAGTSAAAGTNGAAGTSAAAGTNGAAGTSAAAGTNGAAGTVGTSGSAGTNGAAGTSASAGTSGGAGGTTGGGTGGTLGGFTTCASNVSVACPDLNNDGVPDCTQSLVSNPGFDTGISGWQAEGGVETSWDRAGDQNGNTASGALVVKNEIVTTGNGSIVAGASQCVQVMAGAAYDFAAQVAIPTGQGSGSTAASFFYYGSTDCSGALAGTGLSSIVSSAGTCQPISASLTAPAGAQSVAVRLAVIKPFALPSLQAEFDNILFKKH